MKHGLAIAAALVAGVFVFAGCSKATKSEQRSDTVVGIDDAVEISVALLRGVDAEGALSLANKWGTGEKGVVSFVNQRFVEFEFDSGEKASIPLPDYKMVVAIAPYVTQTHPCAIHYLSSCQGELVEIPVKVHGVTSDGEVIVDNELMTMKNGFFELWLPRGLEVDLTIEAVGKKTEGRITTYDDSNTCITTMQLL